MDPAPWAERAGGLVFVLSGPSGVGKDSVLNRLRAVESDLHYCITATTRSRRPGERDAVDYYFLSDGEFDRLRESGGLLEWAVVHDHRYGVPCAQVQEALDRKQDVLACVDVQGAMSIRARIPMATLVFLAPSSREELRARLSGRGTEAPEQVELRLKNAIRELERLPEFDYLIVNAEGGIDAAASELRAIIQSERRRVQPRYASLVGPCGRETH